MLRAISIFQILEKPERECFFCQITTWQILQTLDCIRRFKRIWAEKKISKYVPPYDLIWSNLLKVTKSRKVFHFDSKKEPNIFPEHLLFCWIVLRGVIWAKVKKLSDIKLPLFHTINHQCVYISQSTCSIFLFPSHLLHYCSGEIFPIHYGAESFLNSQWNYYITLLFHEIRKLIRSSKNSSLDSKILSISKLPCNFVNS